MTPETAMRQAPMTVDTYVGSAINYLKGMGATGSDIKIIKDHEGFISSYVSNCIRDYDASLRVSMANEDRVERVLGDRYSQ